MLKEGMDVYVPLVDDHAVDAIVRRKDGSIALVQIKARSADAKDGDAALFAGISHEARPDYWFVFYSERLDLLWILSSAEFLAEAHQNKSGKNVGLRTLWMNGRRRDPATGKPAEYCKPRYSQYLAADFARIRSPAA